MSFWQLRVHFFDKNTKNNTVLFIHHGNPIGSQVQVNFGKDVELREAW
jgi:hypothetical protein